MASYYYYASTLPLLRLDSPLPFSVEAFLSASAGQLSRRDHALLVAAVEGRESAHPFIRKWQRFERLLRSELAAQRSRRKGYVGSPYPHRDETDLRICDTVRQALATDDPLKAELMLLELSFKQLDEAAGLAAFSIEALLAFVLKLQLLERRSRFVQSAGNSEFERLFSHLQREIARR
ncbi:MAG TPA: DUF2764 family protein [Sphaerochaeta sp.]|nr:DUF2764 family protein [Spirochaetota bacterium]NLV60322.1 DUF2764 family protein [Spirochaetales bacterium]HOE83827.1 DUF2764 family protein [Sphaerochaeta sp.]HOQ94294.1 DUF2764 family protein [Sphaerochaeta sp.]HPK46730.1 DUF2764 family protein [Sphaerochaeta sp.]